MSGFRVATIRGIPIRIHVTFLLVLPFIAYGFGKAFVSAARFANVPPLQIAGGPWLWGLGVAVALFASVLMHELAHALYALRAGGRVEEITLLMIGGVSRITEPPKRIREETIMALAGPVMSLVLAGALYLAYLLAARTSFTLRFAFFYLASLNLFLGAFNLLPAFPMDGGRILRSLLTTRIGVLGATRVASRIGKVFAVLFGIWAVLSLNLLLLLVAFFVYVGAETESRAVTVKVLLGHLRIQDVMKAKIVSIPAEITVREVADRMVREGNLFYTVALDGRTTGLLTLDAVAAVPPELRQRTLARDIAIPTPPVAPTEEASKALQIMNETNTPEIAVFDGGRPVGTVSRDDIVRALKVTELEATQRQISSWPPRG